MYADETVPELNLDHISNKWNNVYKEGSHPVLGQSSFRRDMYLFSCDHYKIHTVA